MPRNPVAFRQADLKRALAAAKAAKMDIDRVEIDPVSGKIVMTMRGDAANVDENPLDKWLASHARAS
jgi:hypothetical protein